MSLMKTTYDRLLEYFPVSMEPRPAQKEILETIAEGIDEGFRYFLLDAGTGIGKSAIAVTLAKYFGSAYIITVTKQLQDQYHDEFKFKVQKGRNNFICKESEFFNKNDNCENGICRTTNLKCAYGITLKPEDDSKECFTDRRGQIWYFKSENHCNYWNRKSDAINAHITLMNYASYIPEMNYVSHFQLRKLSIYDEAHNLENQLFNHVSLTLSNSIFKKDFKEALELQKNVSPEMGSEDSIKLSEPKLAEEEYTEDVDKWIKSFHGLINQYKALSVMADLNEKPKQRARNMVRKLEFVRNELLEHYNDWIINPIKPGQDKGKNKEGKIIFKPIEVSRFCKKYIFKHSNYNLLMSATILNKDSFCKRHGLNPEEVLYIPAKSPFKKENRPISIKSVGPMSYNEQKKTLPKTIPVIKEILDNHKDDKGIIHTHTHKLANYLKSKLNDPRIITYSDGGDREKVIEQFKHSKELMVLVAPSVNEGVDLPNELCRFQIIYKIPYPGLNDKQVKARKERDPDWYAYKTVSSIVQAYGRGMRTEDDYCDTYILDKNIEHLLNRRFNSFKFIPDYFKEAITK